MLYIKVIYDVNGIIGYLFGKWGDVVCVGGCGVGEGL